MAGKLWAGMAGRLLAGAGAAGAGAAAAGPAAGGFGLGLGLGLGIGLARAGLGSGARGLGGAGGAGSGLHRLDAVRSRMNAPAGARSGAQGARGPVYSVVLTGGPCGGKSSSLERLVPELKKLGYDVYTAPEVPTVMMNGGSLYPGSDAGEALQAFETALVKMQLQMEDSFYQIAESTGRPSVVFFDRGVLDMAAYLPEEMWGRILAGLGTTAADVLNRYDMVLHLITAADGAAKFYTTANNAARTETADQAVALDRKVARCWEKHPLHRRIPNDGNFEDKLAATVEHVTCMLESGKAPARS